MIFICTTLFVFLIEGNSAASQGVVIGAIYPLTGPAAPAGADVKNGTELAIEIINGEYDLNLPLAKTSGLPALGGKKIKYVFADHQGHPEKSLSEAERLITENHVAALQGTYHSSCAATASQVAERYGIPFLSDVSSSPSLHQRGFKWFFRTSPHDVVFSENFFKFMKELEKEKGVKISTVGVVWENTLYGTDVGKADRKFAKEYGYKMIVDLPYTARSAELTSEVQKIKMNHPQVIMHGAYVSDAILFVKAYKEMDVNFQMIFGHGSGFLDSAFRRELGKDAEYICSWEVWAQDLAKKKPMIGTINEMFKKRFGRSMNGHSARSFTGTFAMVEAVNRAGSTDPKAIRKALRETDIPGEQTIMPWKGIAFDPKTGQNLYGSGIIVQVDGGVYKTVWPFEFAAMDVKWPMPEWSKR
ncbi:MAG: ABC transporter substrate-binding protein [Deltaproteobacteria bacterium]|nr:ABC transporter substrate-binding protein [Deltaproteobacteria bacterium]